ncbi:MAG TPA: glycosyltransferase family A protein [Anaerohalosphaeraceae bacterium]|nr:glycosyltransferase family A protein [Anaerohalosphaeraceae bacterium]HRS70936.1 glycosyltransferase family A protein [Anaerohalosphaeraceae bacterium]HRV20138.1 glycosyltransferase family A protein [Anaerohalosphaeraceae bacterium]
MPKVSVIIPTYNQSRLLKETVGSVLAQTLSDLEVIVVDDGSTDNTQEVVSQIPDARIRYYYTPNRGVSAARNYGLTRAAGQYIAFLDHDDLWPDNFLEVMVRSLEKNTDYGLVYCPVTLAYPDGRRELSYKIHTCKSGWVAPALFKSGFVWTSAAVMRRDVLNGF